MARAGSRRERLLWAGIAALLAGVATLAWLLASGAGPKATAARPVRFELPVPSLTWNATETGLALSPRGDAIVYLSTPAPGRPATMWLRELTDVEPHPVPGTENARNLFWSPDGRRIGFVKDSAIRVVDRAGGAAQTVARAPFTFGPPSWAADGTILFSLLTGDTSRIMRVTAEGGEPVEVTLGVLPSVLPDGRRFLYLKSEGAGEAFVQLFLGSLDGGEARRIEGVRSRAEYAAGHLFYWDQGALVARPFDPGRARFTGAPLSLGEMPGASFARTGMAQFSVARDGGAVAYARGARSIELRWVDRRGNDVGRLGQPGAYESFRISPQGDRVAVEVKDQSIGTADIDVFDLRRGVPTRLVSGPADDANPTWSPDGQRLAYTTDAFGPPRIFIRPADGSGAPRQVRTGENLPLYVNDWSRDDQLIYTAWDQDGDLYVVPVNGEAPSRRFAGGPGDQTHARFSPDGRWVAFGSSELGSMEVFVAPLADGTAKQRVSVAGGRNPAWSRDGSALYYVNDDTVYAATFSPQTRRIATPRALHSLGDPLVAADVDPAPDGERFLVAVRDRRRSGSVITILLHWQGAIGK